MAFLHFGDFLSGMRLSAQDIADREKAELNRRYMEEQMTTMELSRRMNEDELADRVNVRAIRDAQERRAVETHGLETRGKRLMQSSGAALAGQVRPEIVNAAGLQKTLDTYNNAYGAGSEWAGATVVDDGKGGFVVATPGGKQLRLDPRQASEFSYQLYGEKRPDWAADEQARRTAAIDASGRRPPKIIQTDRAKLASQQLLRVQRDLAAAMANPKASQILVGDVLMAREEGIRRLQSEQTKLDRLMQYYTETGLAQRPEDAYDPAPTIAYGVWEAARYGAQPPPAVDKSDPTKWDQVGKNPNKRRHPVTGREYEKKKYGWYTKDPKTGRWIPLEADSGLTGRGASASTAGSSHLKNFNDQNPKQ